MASPIVEKMFEHYAKLLTETEKVVYSIMLSQKAQIKDLKELNLLEIIKRIHESDIVDVSFDEGELIVGECYELHSVCGQRDDDGEPMVFVNLYNTTDEEPISIRLREFPHIGDMARIINAVDEKCVIKFSGE